MLRIFAILFAIIFLLKGILGFIPSYIVNGYLWHIFPANFESNVVYIVLGVLALCVVFPKESYAILYFQICGVILGIWAVLGFVFKENAIFGLFTNNQANTWFHVIFAVISLILGYSTNEKKVS